jgi:hypothetical protein
MCLRVVRDYFIFDYSNNREVSMFARLVTQIVFAWKVAENAYRRNVVLEHLGH